MKSTPSFWKRINPLVFIAAFAFLATVTAYQLWPAFETIPLTVTGTVILGLVLMFWLVSLVTALGCKAPGKNFVAEVNVIHWRGQTPRFWGIYRYKWQASFAAQYMAYMLDHMGSVHWEFGIQFAVHDEAARQAHQDGEELQPT